MSEADRWAARIGTTVCGRYRIESVIGAGGFGVVYRAINLAVGQPVALKLMLGEQTDKDQVVRFEREAMSVSRLRAPNTIRVFDFGRDEGGALFIAMELLAGRPLSTVLDDGGWLSPQRAVHVAIQVAKSLAEAHDIGIIHRDLKPDNIFLADLPGEEDYVKVLDFGIAKLVGDNAVAAHEVTRKGAIIGTPTYMSPEQARGVKVDARSDLYSLGVVLFRMLAGVPPFEAPSMMALMWQHNHDVPPDVATFGRPGAPISPELAALVAQLLAKQQADRPANARAVIQALQDLKLTPLRRADPEAVTVDMSETQTIDLRAQIMARVKVIAEPVQLDAALLERATASLAKSVGPIARVVAKKSAAKARDDRELVQLMAEQLEPHERAAYMTALGYPPQR